MSDHLSGRSPVVDRLGFHLEGANYARLSEQQLSGNQSTVFELYSVKNIDDEANLCKLLNVKRSHHLQNGLLRI